MWIRYVIKLSTFFAVIFFAMQTYALNLNNSAFSDSVITSQVKNKVMINDTLSIFNLGVSTHKGTVNLSGYVETDKDAKTLIEIVQSIKNVTDISIEKLFIKKNKKSLSDLLIEVKIKNLISKEESLNPKNDISVTDIQINSQDSTVSLSGTADTQQQIDEAISLARSINGVKKVKSSIKVVSDYIEN